MLYKKKESKDIINDDIPITEYYYLIYTNEEGEIIKTIVNRQQMLDYQQQYNLDLMLMSKDAITVNNQSMYVCKLLDYKKYIFQIKKKHKSTTNKMKEIQIANRISDHDLTIKVEKIFLMLTQQKPVTLCLKKSKKIRKCNREKNLRKGEIIFDMVIQTLNDMIIKEQSTMKFSYKKKR